MRSSDQPQPTKTFSHPLTGDKVILDVTTGREVNESYTAKMKTDVAQILICPSCGGSGGEYPTCTICGTRKVARAQTTGWHDFTVRPARAMMVEYYHGNWPFLDLPPYRDERRAIGFFDGSSFRELGTGHEVFESWKSNEALPTHWRQAAESPK